MTFAKSSVVGFVTGFVVSMVMLKIRVPTPAFLISADKKTRLTKKEAATRLNDALEDREIFFDFFLEAGGGDPEGMLKTIQLKAMVDPRWLEFLRKFETYGQNDRREDL